VRCVARARRRWASNSERELRALLAHLLAHLLVSSRELLQTLLIDTARRPGRIKR
jgi:hypothetical protein